MEKADILEKTVKHLQELQRQQAAMQQAADPKIINKFKAGFADCANEVSRFPGIEPAVKRRLMQHLQNCINGVKTELHHQQRQANAAVATAASMAVQQLHGQILPSPPSSPEQDHHHAQQHHQYIISSQIQQTPHGYFLPNGLQVIPTKLANGTIALVLPQNQPQQQAVPTIAANNTQHPPMLVPIPSRTASTGSASSHSSYEQSYSNHQIMMHFAPPSPANSHEAMDYKPSVIHHAPALQQNNNQQPLALVTKKQIKEEEQPWRPW